MINSRNIDDLRPDVAVNCRKLIEICKGKGLNVLVTGTLRDAEYQKLAYMNGYSKTPKIGPHAYGLAFDFCKNIKGHEYDDLDFFKKVADIAKEIGFSWGGDWSSFPDRPHLEWLGNPKVSRDKVGKVVVSSMPEYESIPAWATDSLEWAIKEGLTDGTNPNESVSLARLVTILHRYNKKEENQNGND